MKIMKLGKKPYLYLLLLLFSYNTTAQKATINETVVNYMGNTYKVGDIIQLGYGSNNNKDFAFVNFGKSIGNVNLPGLYKKADVNWSKAEVEIVKLYTANGVIWARCNPLNRDVNYLNKQIFINIEGAVDNNEIKSVKANTQQQSKDSDSERDNAPSPSNAPETTNAPSPLKTKKEIVTKTEKQTVEPDKNNDGKPTTLNNRTNANERNVPVISKGTSNANGKIYFRTFSWYSPHGSTLELTWIFLGDNGTIIINPKNGVNPVNYSAELKNNAKNVGKYNIAGDKLNIIWSGGKADQWSLAFDKLGISVMNGGIVTRPQAMPANYKLSGQYAAGAVLSNVASFQTMVFSKDGTFKLNKAGYVSTADVSATSTSDSKGTYKIAGNTLWLNFDNGDVQISVLYIMTYPDGKKRLIINQSSFAQEN